MVKNMGLFLLCLKIFSARILDVSIGTVRTVFTVKGKNLIAAFIGFIEVLIWFLVAREALSTNEVNMWIAVSYSLGYATGTYIGGILSKLLIKSQLNVQVITNNTKLIDILRNDGFAVSVIDIKGKDSNKYMLVIGINNSKKEELIKEIKKNDKDAFVYINETIYIQNGYIK